jgi:hypothetical protein
MCQKRKRFTSRVQSEQQKIRLVVLLKTIHKGLLFRKKAESEPVSQREPKIIQHSEIGLQDKDLRTGFSH